MSVDSLFQSLQPANKTASGVVTYCKCGALNTWQQAHCVFICSPPPVHTDTHALTYSKVCRCVSSLLLEASHSLCDSQQCGWRTWESENISSHLSARPRGKGRECSVLTTPCSTSQCRPGVSHCLMKRWAPLIFSLDYRSVNLHQRQGICGGMGAC